MKRLIYAIENEEHKKKIVSIGNAKIGAGNFAIIAGPCAVESKEQIEKIAIEVKQNGANILRGGTFKPRTNPYSFQGLGIEGMKFLYDAGRKADIPVITEVVDEYSLENVLEYVNAVQIGSRNMQNFSLLKRVGKSNIPVVLKRGYYSTIEEWLSAAEYILSEGNQNVILCERGIRTISEFTRNTLDISAVLVIKKISSLPIIVDPSHACGVREYVLPLSMAAIVVGADGIMVEVHNNPIEALSDGEQSIDFAEFRKLYNKNLKLKKMAVDIES